MWHTYIGSQKLCIPAVTGIVGHLIAHVLAESQLGWVHSDTYQELLNTGHEVAQSLVGN